jgi:hypothetical protein
MTYGGTPPPAYGGAGSTPPPAHATPRPSYLWKVVLPLVVLAGVLVAVYSCTRPDDTPTTPVGTATYPTATYPSPEPTTPTPPSSEPPAPGTSPAPDPSQVPTAVEAGSGGLAADRAWGGGDRALGVGGLVLAGVCGGVLLLRRGRAR